MNSFALSTPSPFVLRREISGFRAAARRGSRSMYYTAGLHLLLFVVFAVASGVDTRTVQGVNAWYKPMKFALSIAFFTGTYAYFFSYLPPQGWRKWLGYGISGCMWTEIILISLQAGRGMASHFNNTTAFDLAIFSVMGMAVLLNTLLTFAVFVRFCFPVASVPPTLLSAIRISMVVFLFGSLVGGYMIRIYAHSVGASGDLRLPHFLGLHAIQLIPGFAWLRSRYRQNPESEVIFFGIAYAGLVVLGFVWAVYG